MTRHGRGLLLGTLLVAAFAPPAARGAVVRQADDTAVTGRLVAIQDGQLIVAPAPAATAPASGPATSPATDRQIAIPLAEISDITLQPSDATAAATGPAARTRASQPAIRPDRDLSAATRRATTRRVSATAPLADPRPWRLTLAGGDTLTLTGGRWSDGVISGTFAGGRAALAVPVRDVAGLWCGTPEQIKAAQALNEPAGSDDIAYAERNGQVLAVRGVAGEVSGASLNFKFNGEDRNIALTRLVGVTFARPPAQGTPATAPQQVFTLAGNESLAGSWTSIDAGGFGVTTPWGQAITLRPQDVTKITFRNGRVVSLSDLKPVEVRQTPYFDRMLSWQADRSHDGKPLVTADGEVARGLALHARTSLTYAIDGAFAEFRSRVGFQQPEGRLGEAIIRVSGDGRVLFEKTDAKGSGPSFDVRADVTGVRKLTIEVDFGPGQDVGDRVVFAAARVLRPVSP